MPDQPFDGTLLEDFEELIERSVRWIVRHENESGFRDWLAKELHGRFGDPQFARALAFSLGRTIWNATPLPSNGFRRRSLGWPGPNEPCPCGSNRKFKHCCGALPKFPDLAPELIWVLTLRSLASAKLAEALASGRVPPIVLGEAGRRLLAERRPSAAIRLLEPLFAGAPEALDERLGDALLVLCDAYTDQGKPAKKRALLERIARSGAPKILRADAAQRLATLASDRGAKEEAWEWFALAQRLNPEDIALAPLEVSLLLAQRRAAEAGERAKFWLKRAERRADVPERLLRMLQALARDPVVFLADAELDSRGIRADALTGWLAQVRDRPLPAYRVQTDDPLDLDDEPAALARLSQMLTAQGLPEREAGRQARKLLSDLKKREALEAQGELPLGEPPDDKAGEERPRGALAAPELAALERAWHEVFPDPKPLATQLELVGPAQAWGERQARWLAFLREHPEAFDSLDILDDLATAIEGDGDVASDWMDQRVLEPILSRAAAIVAAAAPDARGPAIPWTDPRNRAGLRLVVRWIHLLVRQNRGAEARAWIERMLGWDTEDRHGLRGLLALELGRAGDHEAVLALDARFPEDFLLELSYGCALALYSLGRRDEAAAALARAIERNPHVPAMLAYERPARPKDSGFGVEIGSRAEAWYYGDAARDIWAACPGAIEWLKASRRKAARPC